MKKNLFIAMLTLLFVGMAEVSSAQHFYVRVRPAPVVVVRPAAPSPRHVWVENEYEWRGGAYVARPGYWAMPPRGRGRWIPGHWRDDGRRGSYWVPGRWR